MSETIRIEDPRHIKYTGFSADPSRDYGKIEVRTEVFGEHVDYDLSKYKVELVLTPRFEPHWLRGKYNPNCIVYIGSAEAAKRDHPGPAWELVEVKPK